MFLRYKRCVIIVSICCILVVIYLNNITHVQRQNVQGVDIQRVFEEDEEFADVSPTSEIEDINLPICEVDIIKVDPLHKDIMRHIVEFGHLMCPKLENQLTLSIVSNTVNISGAFISSIQNKQITFEQDKPFVIGEEKEIIGVKEIPIMKLSLGTFGAIRNQHGNLCINPAKDYDTDSSEINLIFSIQCYHLDSVFTFQRNGVIRHNVTGKCIAPLGGSEFTDNDTPLVLSQDCETTFNVTPDGLLQHSRGPCIHPLWGGTPEQDQQLCLYRECKEQLRLQYMLIRFALHSNDLMHHQIKMTSEYNLLRVNYFDETFTELFALTLQPQEVSLGGKSPNIYVITIADASAAHIQRKLPLSYKYMHDILAIEGFSSYTPVSSDNEKNILAMLAGSKYRINGDSDLFQLATQSSYVTLYSNDLAGDFLPQYAHHNSVAFFKALKFRIDVASKSYCATGIPIYDLSLNYLTSFIAAYPDTPKFSHVVLSQITSVNFNALGYMDENFVKFLKMVARLKNTIVFFNTIKGSLIGRLASVNQGLLEYNKPYLGIYISKDINESLRIERNRRKRIVTPFDLYATVKHLLLKKDEPHRYGESMFRESSPKTCFRLGINKNMCPCR